MPRVCEVKNGHIYFRPHPDIRAKFNKRTASPTGIYMAKASLSDGDTINIGGYVIKKENGRVITDRSGVIRNHTELKNSFETPELNGAVDVEAYVDGNIIEVFLNGGEYVITNAVYDLSGRMVTEGLYADFSRTALPRGTYVIRSGQLSYTFNVDR